MRILLDLDNPQKKHELFEGERRLREEIEKRWKDKPLVDSDTINKKDIFGFHI